MITINVLHRVFQIKIGDFMGTCFTIDYNERQYIITAKHVVSSLPESREHVIEIWHDKRWKTLDVITLPAHPNNNIDIAVLVAKVAFQAYKLQPSMDGIIYAQDVYFLGFPYGLRSDNIDCKINRGFPFPLVKKGILSAIENGDSGIFFIDGHNNPGFSGGPVIFTDMRSNELKVCGVISAFRFEWNPIYAKQQELPFEYKDNTGITIAYGIDKALEIIKKNPIGAMLES